MAYKKICISSGHGKIVRGASGYLDEVDEARNVVERFAAELERRGAVVYVFHDNTSTTQDQNLKTIVSWHNSHQRELDISVHFNAHQTTDKPMGVEVLYKTQADLAARLSASIAEVGFINRGAKKRPGDAGGSLAFLENTDMPAVLLEICFVDSNTDCMIYAEAFEQICENLAACLVPSNGEVAPPVEPVEPDTPETEGALFTARGRCSEFGGPDDTGVSADEGLAIWPGTDAVITAANQHLFLPIPPAGTTGMARRLNPWVHYIACRWNYDVTPREMLRENLALVRSTATGYAIAAFPADWGPHENTGRVADLSPGLMLDLGLDTDDEVEVIFPYDPEAQS
jgi:N-acetylmuramoyl-L-alanine amidase